MNSARLEYEMKIKGVSIIELREKLECHALHFIVNEPESLNLHKGKFKKL